MNGKKIPDEQVEALLELADWAPTHGSTEPWRFVVYSNPTDFCHQHAELYKQSVTTDNFDNGTYNKLYTQGDKASHVIVAVMKRGSLPKIPAVEEIEAVACAVQNILLGATAMGIASFWSTGGMISKQPMKDMMELGEEDRLTGVLYLGYADNNPAGSRVIPLKEKIKWLR